MMRALPLLEEDFVFIVVNSQTRRVRIKLKKGSIHADDVTNFRQGPKQAKLLAVGDHQFIKNDFIPFIFHAHSFQVYKNDLGCIW